MKRKLSDLFQAVLVKDFKKQILDILNNISSLYGVAAAG